MTKNKNFPQKSNCIQRCVRNYIILLKFVWFKSFFFSKINFFFKNQIFDLKPNFWFKTQFWSKKYRKLGQNLTLLWKIILQKWSLFDFIPFRIFQLFHLIRFLKPNLYFKFLELFIYFCNIINLNRTEQNVFKIGRNYGFQNWAGHFGFSKLHVLFQKEKTFWKSEKKITIW